MKITHRTCLRLLLPVLISLVQGCSSVTTYPSNWAPVSAQFPSTCAAIAGDYKNRGIEVRDGGYIYDAYLQGEFLSDPSPVTLKTHVTTSQDAGEKLTVEYWLGEKRLREREYNCIDGIPVNEYSSVPGFGMLGVSKVIERLFLADDGALIEFTSMDTKGISLVVLPLVDHQDWWTRFEAYDGGPTKGLTMELTLSLPWHQTTSRTKVRMRTMSLSPSSLRTKRLGLPHHQI